MGDLHCHFCGAALEALTVACPFCGAQPVLGERYEIRAVIGRGGMGEVFLAYDRRLANEVAIKRLTPQFSSIPELRDSLTKEARMLARLSDSGIVRLFDLADFSGDLYLIMEYVCGPSLREMIRTGYRASPLELARMMAAICQGLGVAHRQGIIHRDLKPSNLLLALDGADQTAFRASKALPRNLANATVKIADFVSPRPSPILAPPLPMPSMARPDTWRRNSFAAKHRRRRPTCTPWASSLASF